MVRAPRRSCRCCTGAVQSDVQSRRRVQLHAGLCHHRRQGRLSISSKPKLVLSRTLCLLHRIICVCSRPRGAAIVEGMLMSRCVVRGQVICMHGGLSQDMMDSSIDLRRKINDLVRQGMHIVSQPCVRHRHRA